MSKLTQHFKNNKVAYVVGGTAVVVVAGVAYYVGGQKAAAAVASKALEANAEVVQTITQSAGQFANYKPTINQTFINFVERSTPSKMVGLLGEDGAVVQAYSSLSEAARQTGHSLSQISKNVNGKIESVAGDVFAALEPVAA